MSQSSTLPDRAPPAVPEQALAKPAPAAPPARWPIVAAAGGLTLSAAILGAAILGALAGSTLLTGLGYVVGALVVPSLLVVRRTLAPDAGPRSAATLRDRLSTLPVLLLTLGLAVGLANGFLLATEIAKR